MGITTEFLKSIYNAITFEFPKDTSDLKNIIDSIEAEEYPWFERAKAKHYETLREDPNYVNLTDECLMDMAESLTKIDAYSMSKQSFIWTGLVDIIIRMSEHIGIAMGTMANAQEYGKQLANADNPVTLPDISSLIAGAFKETFTKEEINGWSHAMGYTTDTFNKMLDGLRPALDTAIVVALWHRMWIDRDNAVILLQKQGYLETQADDILKASMALFTPYEARELYRREFITEIEHDEILTSNGYTDTDIARFKKLYDVIPPIPDIIRMAVREAWDEGAIKLGALDSELPSEAAAEGKKMGLTEEWFRKYWIAHWVIPPVMQGYEMMHRGVITTEELNTLMRALDIAPGWRDKLMAISYSPYTRVDVRRMYKWGVIGRDEVKRTYLDLGYDDEHAENLTDYTVMDATSEIRGLTRAQILDLYIRNLIDEKTATEWLTDIGYPAEIVDVLIADADYKKEKKIKDKYISMCHKMYLQDIYDDNKVIEVLSSINMLAAEITDWLDQWSIEKQELTKTLTWGMLRKLLEKNLIDKPTFTMYMKRLRYSDEDIELLWQLSGVEITPGEE